MDENTLRLLAKQEGELAQKWESLASQLWNAIPSAFTQLRNLYWVRGIKDFALWIKRLSENTILYCLIEEGNVRTYGFNNFSSLTQALLPWQTAWPQIQISLDTRQPDKACLQFTLKN